MWTFVPKPTPCMLAMHLHRIVLCIRWMCAAIVQLNLVTWYLYVYVCQSVVILQWVYDEIRMRVMLVAEMIM